MRIAMWSGPRNLSTAMMYAFRARGDCAVLDEPFYAAFLAATGADHPMRAEVIAAGETDPSRVAARLRAPAPGGRPLFYQKHMVHHMLPGFGAGWMREVVHVFLIRHPARVVASYDAKRPAPTAADLGFERQVALFEAVRAFQPAVPVIDSTDLRADPAGVLAGLCEAIGIGWTPSMLSWPAGGIPEDGIWAAHWYDSVHRSTGFAGPEGPLPEVPPACRDLVAAALPGYERLRALAIRPRAE